MFTLYQLYTILKDFSVTEFILFIHAKIIKCFFEKKKIRSHMAEFSIQLKYNNNIYEMNSSLVPSLYDLLWRHMLLLQASSSTIK